MGWCGCTLTGRPSLGRRGWCRSCRGGPADAPPAGPAPCSSWRSIGALGRLILPDRLSLFFRWRSLIAR
eukprot:9425382-Pyramimonas_sp.AAC.1